MKNMPWMTRFLITVVMLLAGAALLTGTAQAQGAIADHTVIEDFESIPLNWIDSASQKIQMYYLHQSHGSQIMQGMAMLNDDDSRYYPHRMEAEWWLYPNGLELGENGDTGWVPQVRRYLDTNSVNCNLVSVSWCAGAHTLNETETIKYLTGWRNMERDYPDVTFVYQTSRLTKVDWPDSRRVAILRTNAQIRQWCADSSCYLMDYGAIEGHEPDGSYDEYATDSCTTWCEDYCDTLTAGCPDCVTDTFDGIWNRSIMGPTVDCAHSTAAPGDSHGCLNCFRKGKAWWWLMTRVVQDKAGIVQTDTVTIASKSVATDAGTVTVEVSLSNHQDLGAFDIPIRWNSPDITCDSISYVGSRVEYVSMTPFEIDNDTQKLHGGMIIVAEANLPPGDGLIMTLHFSVNAAAAEQTIDIDTTFYPPTGSFILTTPTGDILRPVCVPGQLSLILAADTTPPAQIEDLGAAPVYFNKLFRPGTALAGKGSDITDEIYFQRSLTQR